jgi:hypothetical protein
LLNCPGSFFRHFSIESTNAAPHMRRFKSFSAASCHVVYKIWASPYIIQARIFFLCQETSSIHTRNNAKSLGFRVHISHNTHFSGSPKLQQFTQRPNSAAPRGQTSPDPSAPKKNSLQTVQRSPPTFFLL